MSDLHEPFEDGKTDLFKEWCEKNNFPYIEYKMAEPYIISAAQYATNSMQAESRFFYRESFEIPVNNEVFHLNFTYSGGQLNCSISEEI